MLACLVHKDCKDISMRPMELPPGRTRVEAREDSCRALEGERAEAKSKRSPDPFREIEHQLKQARVVGMRAQAAQIAIQSIQTKIQMLRENADVYIQIHGQQGYNEIIASLLSRMARMGEEDTREISTPVSVGYSQILERVAAEDEISERVAAEDDTNSSL
jgi:hypothetical protein